VKIIQRVPLRLWLAAAAGLFLLMSLFTSDRVQAAPELHWYKGNLHTHTVNSDGDSTPNDVASWYKEHRYNFLVLTDHNFRTEIDGLNSLHAAKDRFLLIPGEEVTDSFAKAPVHINAYDGSSLVEPTHGQSMVATIQRNVDAIRRVNGLPSVNHPNFGWAITSKDLLEIQNLNLFEVYNGHPYVNNSGGGGVESMDELWDTLLSAGRRINGIAVDDAHHFKQLGRDRSNPGRGWVVVKAPELTRSAIREALISGKFYASNGVELTDVRSSESELSVEIKPAGAAKHRTYFIGEQGKILGTSVDDVAVYKIRGNEKYVRARVESSTGDMAWTQPVYPGAR